MPSQIIDREDSLQNLLGKFQAHTQEQRLLFLDLEGVNLSRHGVVSIIQLLMPPDPMVYLLDVYKFGAKAFTTTHSGSSTSSLQSVLESSNVMKIMFDVRNDCNALYFQFGISLQSVVDLQLLEYATRSPRGRFVNGLAKCVTNESRQLPTSLGNWHIQKLQGQKLFSPERGGDYEIFLKRPLPQAIFNYCEQDASVMPALLPLYARRLEPHIAAQLQDLVNERVRSAESPEFNGEGRHMAIGPTLYPRRLVRDLRFTFPMCIINSSEINDLCQLKTPSEGSSDLLETSSERPSNLVLAQTDREQNDLVSSAEAVQPEILAYTLETPNEIYTSDQTDEKLAEALNESLRLGSSTHSHSIGHSEGYNLDVANENSDNNDEYQYGSLGFRSGYSRHEDDDDMFKDLTACDKECGYCGQCSY